MSCCFIAASQRCPWKTLMKRTPPSGRNINGTPGQPLWRRRVVYLDLWGCLSSGPRSWMMGKVLEDKIGWTRTGDLGKSDVAWPVEMSPKWRCVSKCSLPTTEETLSNQVDRMAHPPYVSQSFSLATLELTQWNLKWGSWWQEPTARTLSL
jgi:hypothetical protein